MIKVQAMDCKDLVKCDVCQRPRSYFIKVGYMNARLCQLCAGTLKVKIMFAQEETAADQQQPAQLTLDDYERGAAE